MQKCPKCGQMNAYWVTMCIRCSAKLPGMKPPAHMSVQTQRQQTPQPRTYGCLIFAAFLVPMFGLIGGGLAMLLGDNDMRETGYKMIVAAVASMLILTALFVLFVILAGTANVLQGAQ